MFACCVQADDGLHNPSTSLHNPSTFLHNPSSSLHSPSTFPAQDSPPSKIALGSSHCYPRSMFDFNSIAEMMQSCAGEAIGIAHHQFGFALDYSGASIESLETILANVGAKLDLSDKDAVEQSVKTVGRLFWRNSPSQFWRRLGPHSISWTRCGPPDPGGCRIATVPTAEGVSTVDPRRFGKCLEILRTDSRTSRLSHPTRRDLPTT